MREPEQGKRAHLSAAIPLPLKRWLEKEAKKNGWSLSAEIVSRLERTRVDDDIHARISRGETVLMHEKIGGERHVVPAKDVAEIVPSLKRASSNWRERNEPAQR